MNDPLPKNITGKNKKQRKFVTSACCTGSFIATEPHLTFLRLYDDCCANRGNDDADDDATTRVCEIDIRIEVIDSQSSFAAASEWHVPTSPRRVFPPKRVAFFSFHPKLPSADVRFHLRYCCGMWWHYIGTHPHRYLHTTCGAVPDASQLDTTTICTLHALPPRLYKYPPAYTRRQQILERQAVAKPRTMPPIESYRGESNRIEPNRTES